MLYTLVSWTLGNLSQCQEYNAAVKRAKLNFTYLSDQARLLADPVTALLANDGAWLVWCGQRSILHHFSLCSLGRRTLFGVIGRRQICSLMPLSTKLPPLIQRHSILAQQTLNLPFTLPQYLPGRSETFSSHYPTNRPLILMEHPTNFWKKPAWVLVGPVTTLFNRSISRKKKVSIWWSVVEDRNVWHHKTPYLWLAFRYHKLKVTYILE